MLRGGSGIDIKYPRLVHGQAACQTGMARLLDIKIKQRYLLQSIDAPSGVDWG